MLTVRGIVKWGTSFLLNSFATSSLVLVHGGCYNMVGGSPSNCWMYSPKSVSTLSIPLLQAFYSGEFLPVTMLLLFTSVLQFCCANVQHFCNGLFCIFGPYHFTAAFGKVKFKLFQLLVQRFNGTPFYILGTFPCRCTSSKLLFTFRTFSLYLPMLKLILRRCSRSATALIFFAINVWDASLMIIFLKTGYCNTVQQQWRRITFNSGNHYHLFIGAKDETLLQQSWLKTVFKTHLSARQALW